MRFLWDITIGLIFRILFSPSPPRHIERDDTEVEHWAVKQSRTGRDDWDQDDPRNYG